MKEKIIRDLDRFRQGKEFHSRVGRPWKRGYLLYGPPGTGKSSLVAAIADYMKYDVYDLELTKVQDNSELRSLLIKTTNKSMIVIEDIDCSLDLTNRLSKPPKLDGGNMDDEERSGSRVTLSGILNFTDGLWSCCGEERIMVFTTNHKDRLDPALLRSGRMDMHIHLSFCAFPAFKRLAFNYLQVEDHPLFSAVEESMSGAEMTPADISEILIDHLDDPVRALNEVISALNAKKPSSISGFERYEAIEERIAAEEEGVRFRGGQEGPKVLELTNGY
jgi:chaperone BCS1